MICNSSTILYHDLADPADPGDITYIRNDLLWSTSHLLPYIMIRQIWPISTLIGYDSQVIYLPWCETYVLMGGPGGTCPPGKSVNFLTTVLEKNEDIALLHQDDIPLLIEMTWHCFTLKIFPWFKLKTMKCTEMKILHCFKTYILYSWLRKTLHWKHKIADVADRCGYSHHPADPADAADHVFRKNRKISSHPQERQNSGCCVLLRI